LAFQKPIREKNVKVIALPEIQETSDVPCDLGSDLAVLEKEIRENELPVDLSLVTEGWNDKVSGCSPVQGVSLLDCMLIIYALDAWEIRREYTGHCSSSSGSSAVAERPA
jgi:hypothetical protein